MKSIARSAPSLALAWLAATLVGVGAVGTVVVVLVLTTAALG